MTEIERLKAGNASLRKNLDDYAGCVARMEEKLAAAEKERDETRRSADGIAGELANWRAMADRNTKALAAAEQRAEAAEKERDEEKARANRMLQLATSLLGIPEKAPDCSLCGAWSAGKPLCIDCAAARLLAAGQRNAELEGALRLVLRDASLSSDGNTYITVTDADCRTAFAALHDEERPPDRCPACGVRGLSTDRLWGACHALECPDPMAWLRARETSRAKPPAGPSEAISETAAQGEEK